MDSYRWALFFHVLGAVVFFGGIAVAGAGFGSARRRSRPSEVALLLGLTRTGVALVGVGGVLVLAFGLWLVDLGGHSLGETWLALALSLFVASGVLGGLGGRRPKEARRLAARLAQEGDRPSAELTRLLSDPVSLGLNLAATLAALAVLGLMVWQPS